MGQKLNSDRVAIRKRATGDSGDLGDSGRSRIHMKTLHRLVHGKEEKRPEKTRVYNLSICPKHASITT